ncbi:MAG: FtsH protease activity modulator HflK [bacterium]
MDWKSFKPKNQQNSNPNQTPKDGSKKPFEIKLPKLNLSKVNLISILYIIGGVFGLWLLTGIYVINPGEVGIIRRFGRFDRTIMNHGLHYHLPVLMERLDKLEEGEEKKIEVGFRSPDSKTLIRYVSDKPEESMVLTGDENIVNIDMIVRYRLKDILHFLFHVENPEETIREAAEASLRVAIGERTIDEVLNKNREEIKERIVTLLQNTVDKYNFGVTITNIQLSEVTPPKEVIEAFKSMDSAEDEKKKLIKEAENYRDILLAEANEKFAKMTAEAEAYKEERLNRAQGDVARFLALLEEYRRSKDVTKKRIYLETLEEILPYMKKVVIDDKIRNQGLGLIDIFQSPENKAENNKHALKQSPNGGEDRG